MKAHVVRNEDSNISLHNFGYKSEDICVGADPFLFHQNGEWHLLVHENINEDPLAHDGIKGYSVRSAENIEKLVASTPVFLDVSFQPENLKQVWAAEIHFEKYMYVAISDGNNHTHRMHVYETEGTVQGPWKYKGPLKMPAHDERWAIDLTLATMVVNNEEIMYAIWSGWEMPVWNTTPENFYENIIPQSLYIAEFLSPLEIGPRHVLTHPQDDWCCSVAPILEGPQSLHINGRFEGLLVTGNASWTDSYATNVLRYGGGDPLLGSSWRMHEKPLFENGYGIGHGMMVEQGPDLYYVGHRKTRRDHGWKDRVVFYAQMPREKFAQYLADSVKCLAV